MFAPDDAQSDVYKALDTSNHRVLKRQEPKLRPAQMVKSNEHEAKLATPVRRRLRLDDEHVTQDECLSPMHHTSAALKAARVWSKQQNKGRSESDLRRSRGGSGRKRQPTQVPRLLVIRREEALCKRNTVARRFFCSRSQRRRRWPRWWRSR